MVLSYSPSCLKDIVHYAAYSALTQHAMSAYCLRVSITNPKPLHALNQAFAKEVRGNICRLNWILNERVHYSKCDRH